MIESLETRNLLTAAPTAVLGLDGTLTVTGTKNYDRIAVDVSANLGTAPKGGVVTGTLTGYTIKDKDKVLGTFDAIKVKKIVINALGGSDRVTGPGLSGFSDKVGPAGVIVDDAPTYVGRLSTGGSADAYTVGKDGNTQVYTKVTNLASGSAVATGKGYSVVNSATLASLLQGQFAPTEINGGAGNDRITGGLGDDTINGGTGNDTLVDTYGSNVINGNAGNDTIDVLEGKQLHKGTTITAGSLATGGTPDTVDGGAGRDTVLSNGDDVLADPSDAAIHVSGKNGYTVVKTGVAHAYTTARGSR